MESARGGGPECKLLHWVTAVAPSRGANELIIQWAMAVAPNESGDHVRSREDGLGDRRQPLLEILCDLRKCSVSSSFTRLTEIQGVWRLVSRE